MISEFKEITRKLKEEGAHNFVKPFISSSSDISEKKSAYSIYFVSYMNLYKLKL